MGEVRICFECKHWDGDKRMPCCKRFVGIARPVSGLIFECCADERRNATLKERLFGHDRCGPEVRYFRPQQGGKSALGEG